MGSSEQTPKIRLNFEDWTRFAACSVFEDLQMFFPEVGESAKEAKIICAGCPVWRKCLNYSLINHEKWGVWGGLTEAERKKVKNSSHVGICTGCNLIRVFFEKDATRCDKCCGTTRRKRRGSASSAT